jgi:thiosulfate dehydrogenase [quinone] large subunit
MNTATDYSLAHGLARLGLGVNIALHGLTRLPNIPGFAQSFKEQFAKSILSPAWVELSAYGIVYAEVIIGLLLTFGLLLRPALIAGALKMIMLLFGVCLIQNWNAAGTQMIYLAFYAVLLATARLDRYSLDQLFAKRR